MGNCSILIKAKTKKRTALEAGSVTNNSKQILHLLIKTMVRALESVDLKEVSVTNHLDATTLYSKLHCQVPNYQGALFYRLSLSSALSYSISNLKDVCGVVCVPLDWSPSMDKSPKLVMILTYHWYVRTLDFTGVCTYMILKVETTRAGGQGRGEDALA